MPLHNVFGFLVLFRINGSRRHVTFQRPVPGGPREGTSSHCALGSIFFSWADSSIIN
jgi:hypothetical protein